MDLSVISVERAGVCPRSGLAAAEMIIRKIRNELDQMRKSGMLVWQILQDLFNDPQSAVSSDCG